MLAAGLGERGGPRLLVDLVVLGPQARDHPVDAAIELGRVLGRTRDDQGRAGFVDEDAVDLVDDRKQKRPLNHVGQPMLHVVAEVVEPELVVGAVGDVGLVGRPSFLIVEARNDAADLEPEEVVDRAHPAGVPACQVVVDRHDVHAPGERVEVRGQRRDERLAFAGLHLRDAPLVEHDAADELHVEGALSERPLRRLADGGKRLGQEIVEGFTVVEPFAELAGACPQSLVGAGARIGLKRIDVLDSLVIFAKCALVRCPEDALGNST